MSKSTIEEIESFPLHWPLGFKRTPAGQRIRSPFKQTMEASQRFLRLELERLCAGAPVISTNIPVRKDGGMYVEYMSRKMEDPGVAIYFRMGSQADGYTSMCCDQYLTVWENTYALGKSIEAIRAIERYGCSEFMSRVFSGFKELPMETAGSPWWEVLGIPRSSSQTEIRAAYLEKAKQSHPDRGGTGAEFIRVQKAYEEAIA